MAPSLFRSVCLCAKAELARDIARSEIVKHLIEDSCKRLLDASEQHRLRCLSLTQFGDELSEPISSSDWT